MEVFDAILGRVFFVNHVVDLLLQNFVLFFLLV